MAERQHGLGVPGFDATLWCARLVAMLEYLAAAPTDPLSVLMARATLREYDSALERASGAEPVANVVPIRTLDAVIDETLKGAS
jgi:hypothetical protein